MLPGDSNRVDEAVRYFAEQFGLLLTDAGLPRMAARVFAFVLADDAEIYTAGELAKGLRVSPAAVSGAVRTLVRVGLLAKDRLPGARSDHYRVYDDDVWSAIAEQLAPMLQRYDDVLSDGLKLLDLNRPGGRRVYETREFYRFIRTEQRAAMQRWREHRRTLFDDLDTIGATKSSPDT